MFSCVDSSSIKGAPVSLGHPHPQPTTTTIPNPCGMWEIDFALGSRGGQTTQTEASQYITPPPDPSDWFKDGQAT